MFGASTGLRIYGRIKHIILTVNKSEKASTITCSAWITFYDMLSSLRWSDCQPLARPLQCCNNTGEKKKLLLCGIRRLSCHTPLRLLIASSMGLGLRAAGQNWQADLTSWPSHLIRVSWLPSVTQAGFVWWYHNWVVESTPKQLPQKKQSKKRTSCHDHVWGSTWSHA